MIKDFFPEVFRLNESEQKSENMSQAFAIARELYGEGIPRILQACLNDKTSSSQEEKVSLLREELFGMSRFEVENEPAGFFERKSTANFVNEVFLGRVRQLVGVPKIGKSFLVHQLKKTKPIKIYNVPYGKGEQEVFVNSLILEVREKYESKEKSGQGELVFAIDNIERLDTFLLNQLDDYLFNLNISESQNLGILFVSNENFQQKVKSIEDVLVAPKWNEEDIGKIIDLNKVDSNHKDDYLKTLTSISGGHPLIAKVIAEKSKTSQEIYLNKIISPEVTDEKLSRETTILLYDKVLKDADDINFIQRLSLCVSKLDEIELDSIVKVEPIIKKPIKRLVDVIGPSIIEGSIQNGVEVNSIFKNVAKQNISGEEAKQVFSALADANWRIEGKTINGDSAIKGMNYLLFSDRIDEAYSRGLFLVMGLKENSDKEIVTSVISRIDILFYLNEEKIKTSWAYFSSVVFKMAMLSLLGRFGLADKYYKYLQRIDFERLKKCIEELKTPTETEIIAAITFNYIAYFEKYEKRSELLDTLGNLIEENYKGVSVWIEDLLPLFCTKIDENDQGEINSFIKLSERMFQLNPSLAISMISNWGGRLKGKLDSENFNAVKSIFSNNILNEVLSANYVDLKDLNIEKVLEALKTGGLNEDDAGEHIVCLIADKYFNEKDYIKAEEYYLKLKEIAKEERDFLYPWAIWKIGLIKKESEESIDLLKLAHTEFKKSGFRGYEARALAAAAVQCFKFDNVDEAVSLAESLFDSLFSGSNKNAAPAVKMIGAQLMRLNHEYDGREIRVDNQNFPEMNLDHYDTFLDSIEYKESGMLLYSQLAPSCKKINKDDEALRLIIKGLSQPIVCDNDRQFVKMVARELFTIDSFSYEKVGEEFIKKFSEKIARSYQAESDLGRDTEIAFQIFWDEPLRMDTKKRLRYSKFMFELADGCLEFVSNNKKFDSPLLGACLNYYKFCFGCDLKLGREALQPFLNEAISAAEKGEVSYITIEAYYNKLINYSDSIPSISTAIIMFNRILELISLEGHFKSRLDDFGERLLKYWRMDGFVEIKGNDGQILNYFKKIISQFEYFRLDEEQAAFFVTVNFCIVTQVKNNKVIQELLARKSEIEKTLPSLAFQMLGDPAGLK